MLIEDGVTIERSEIGPNVTIEAGTRIAGSTVRDAIVGRDGMLDGVRLERALLGNRVALRALRAVDVSLGDDSTLVAED